MTQIVKILFLLSSVIVAVSSQSTDLQGKNDLNPNNFVYSEPPKNKSIQNKPLRNFPQNGKPIRVTTDISYFDQTLIPKETMNKVNSLIEILVNFAAKFIKVVPSGPNIIDLAKCNHPLIPKNQPIIHKKESDLHIYFLHSGNEQVDDLATSNDCGFEPGQIRPKFAFIILDLNSFKEYENYEEGFQTLATVMIREFFHIVGFNYRLFNKFIDKYTQKLKGRRNLTLMYGEQLLLKSPKVLQTARKYFGCQTLPGYPFSRQNSLWDHSASQLSIMNERSHQFGYNISILSVAVIQDSGFWVSVNENFADPYLMGKDIGCDKFMRLINVLSSYFQTKLPICFHNYELGENKFSDEDPYLEDFSHESKCFYSTLFKSNNEEQKIKRQTQTRKHKYECFQGSDGQTTIQISFPQIPKLNVTCSPGEMYVEKKVIYNEQEIGKIECPKDYQAICAYKQCKDFCHYHGLCIRGVCHCNHGFSGENCQIQNEDPNLYYHINGFVKKCPNLTFANPDNTCKETCPNGYYKDTTLNKCELCDFSCSECSGPSKNECKACQFLSHLVENFCISCQFDQYFDHINKRCEYCSFGCESCESLSICYICRNGFELTDDQTCKYVEKKVSCSANCKVCDKVLNVCKVCHKNFYLELSICKPCIKGCLSCTSLNECKTCDKRKGYKLFIFQNQKMCFISKNCKLDSDCDMDDPSDNICRDWSQNKFAWKPGKCYHK